MMINNTDRIYQAHVADVEESKINVDHDYLLGSNHTIYKDHCFSYLLNRDSTLYTTHTQDERGEYTSSSSRDVHVDVLLYTRYQRSQ